MGLYGALALALAAPPTVVPVPLGETPVGDIGIYRVAYQSYGGDVVEMPPSWIGHFEPVSGISYMPNESVAGRRAILLHSPWRRPPGRAWVDYPLALPDATPLELRFGITMLPEVAVPGKSDGVTFVVVVDERELFREHYDQGVWKDVSLDLSPWRGRTVTLRLQTEPGPANNPSFDYSYFGDAVIVAGTAGAARQALLERLTASRAYRATAGVPLTAAANEPTQGVAPSNLLPCRTDLRRDGDVWWFSYQADDTELTWRYEPRTGALDDFTVEIDGHEVRPAAGGGVVLAGASGIAGDGRLVSAEAADGRVTAVFEYPHPEGPVTVTWTFALRGKALCVEAVSETPRIERFSLGQVADVPFRREFGVPYLPADWSRGRVTYLPAEALYVSRYLDWTVSHSSRCPQGEAVYERTTAGRLNPLRESGYVAVSPTFAEVVPNIPHPPSPYLELLGPRVMLDIWGHHKNSYEGDAELLAELKDNGVDHVAIIQHVWQRYGYDVKLPDHLPADPRFGGDDGMAAFGKMANACGYVWSVHENYIDLYPDAPSYDPSARVLRADGSPSPAWFNAGTGVQSFGLKCNRALGYAEQNSPEIHRRYGTTAAYLDVHTCVPPWHQLDHEEGQPMAAMALAKVKYDSELFAYMRRTHEGPLFGEGANHFYWAGLVDGVEAQVSGGEDHEPLLDFDLLKIHPQMVNHGMGYYERWFRNGYNHRFGHDTGSPEQVDKYRAQELAYGHAGFIGAAQVSNVQWVAKEHHLMHAVQRLYGAARVTAIDYFIDGRFVTASVALAIGDRWRQRIRYDSGLTLYINWAPEPWDVEGRRLPQWGWLATGPDTLACTVLHGGAYADFVDIPEYLFIDARTSFHMPYLRAEADVEPRLASFRDLGDGKIELTYEWVVGEQGRLDRELMCFVHFVNEGGSQPDGIQFQQDHRLPRPTTGWRPGEIITDGPYQVTVPAEGFDTYDLMIGLYGLDNGRREPLKGRQAGGDRIHLARLGVTREGGRVTAVKLLALPPEKPDQRADFTAHLNPPGTVVDFGVLATDGSAKIERGERRLTIYPYPRDQAFMLALDLTKLLGAGAPEPAAVKVRALAALTKADLGPVATEVRDGRLVLRLGLAGAGRYELTW